MASSSIKASRNKDNLWVEVARYGHHDGSESCDVFSITHGGIQCTRPSNVDVEPCAIVNTNLLRIASTGEEVAVIVSMEGDVQDMRVIVEYLLKSVAMVDILK